MGHESEHCFIRTCNAFVDRTDPYSVQTHTPTINSLRFPGSEQAFDIASKPGHSRINPSKGLALPPTAHPNLETHTQPPPFMAASASSFEAGSSLTAATDESPTLRHGGSPRMSSPLASSSGGAQAATTTAAPPRASGDRVGLLKSFQRQWPGQRRRRSDDVASSIPEERNGDAVLSVMSPFDQQQEHEQPPPPSSLARLPNHAKRSPYSAESHTFEADESDVWRIHEVYLEVCFGAWRSHRPNIYIRPSPLAAPAPGRGALRGAFRTAAGLFAVDIDCLSGRADGAGLRLHHRLQHHAAGVEVRRRPPPSEACT